MKINIPEIEQKIYYNICSNFANWCEMQLQQYESVLKFLDYITYEILTETNIVDLYKNYTSFCEVNKLDFLPNKLFTSVITSFGFYRFDTSRNGKRKGYFRPISDKK